MHDVFAANSIRVGAEVVALMDADQEYEFEVAAPVDVLMRKVTLHASTNTSNTLHFNKS